MEKELYEKFEIIDAHGHIFPEKIAENATVNIGNFYDIPMHGCGMSEKLIESGKKIGVKQYLVCSTATTPHQIDAINRFIMKECAAHPEFFGLGTTHADSYDIEGDIQQIIDAGLHGVKLHPDFQLFNADSKEAFQIYDAMQGRLPLMIHCGDNRYDYSAPQRIANIHKNFPKLKIQAAHLGGYQQWDDAVDCLKGLENVAFDFSSSLAFLPPEKAAKIIHTYGVENCFYGSDFPMWTHEEELERTFAMGFTEDELHKLLGQNFKEFYGII